MSFKDKIVTKLHIPKSIIPQKSVIVPDDNKKMLPMVFLPESVSLRIMFRQNEERKIT